MDNQHRKISGYRELTQEEIDLMNKIKSLGPQLEELCDQVLAHIKSQRDLLEQAEGVVGCDATIERNRLDAANPEHWESWGRSSFQSALMFLTRSVAQPSFF